MPIVLLMYGTLTFRKYVTQLVSESLIGAMQLESEEKIVQHFKISRGFTRNFEERLFSGKSSFYRTKRSANIIRTQVSSITFTYILGGLFRILNETLYS